LAPAEYSGLPNVRKAIWALITCPPHLTTAVRPDDAAAKVYVALVVPLSLQLFCKQADVGPKAFRLFLLRLSLAGIAVANERGSLCRSTCMP